MSDLFDLRGRRALVTGASRGIGLAIAAEFVRRGAAVAITGRKADALEAAATQLRAAGGQVLPLTCHQGDARAITQLYEQLDRQGWELDIAVINAATNPVMGPLVEIELAAWQKILDVNLTGALLTAQQAYRRMLARRRGAIVFMASVAGIEPVAGIGAYSVSKAGLLGLMRTLAREVGASGIRVNAVAPGLIETRFAEALLQDKQGYQELIAGTPLRRHGQPSDVVGAALYLASDASAYVTGQVIVVDGGGRV